MVPYTRVINTRPLSRLSILEEFPMLSCFKWSGDAQPQAVADRPEEARFSGAYGALLFQVFKLGGPPQ